MRRSSSFPCIVAFTITLLLQTSTSFVWYHHRLSSVLWHSNVVYSAARDQGGEYGRKGDKVGRDYETVRREYFQQMGVRDEEMVSMTISH